VKPLNWKHEALAALALVGFGLGVLPGLVYLVGQEILGDYEGADGLATLYGAIVSALLRGQLFAWILVLSPYLVIVLVRLFAAVRRTRPGRRPA